MTRDLEGLRRLLVPDQPELERARAAIHGISDAETAWKQLAERGVIPVNWTSGSERSFFLVPCPACDVDERGDWKEWGCPACSASGYEFAYPRNLQACLAIAANPQGVVRAEASAREAILRLRAWGEKVGDKLVWQIESKLRILESGFRRPPKAIYMSHAGEWFAGADPFAQDRKFAAPLGEESRLFSDVIVCLHGERTYDAFARRRVAPYDERANPYTPLLDILALGYAPRRFEERGFALVAPLVE